MISLLTCVRAASVGLLGFELILLLIRSAHAPSKLELSWFTLVAILVTGAGFVPSAFLQLALFSPIVLWACGAYVSCLVGESRPWIWHAAVAAVMLVIVLVLTIGLIDTLPFCLLFIFFFCLLSVYPVFLMIGLCRMNRHALLYFYTAATTVLLAALAYDLLSLGADLPELRARIYTGLIYIVACGLLLAQESYLQGMGLYGLHIRLGVQQKRLRQAHSRLIQTENTLLLQDRLIATGMLTAGAAHEFKNALSSIKTSAGYGLRADSKQAMHQALHLVMEQAEVGRESVMEFLDQLLQQGREKPSTVIPKTDLQGLLKMVRTSCRREGIHLSADFPADVKLRLRRSELEQVLLNLIRNSMDGIRENASPSAGARTIALRCYYHDGNVLIEVSDSGPGVPEELQDRIFDLSVSDKQSTGLGLFLAKMLVERNGGSLTYVPIETGSCFRIIFPP